MRTSHLIHKKLREALAAALTIVVLVVVLIVGAFVYDWAVRNAELFRMYLAWSVSFTLAALVYSGFSKLLRVVDDDEGSNGGSHISAERTEHESTPTRDSPSKL